jgi:rhodanese-related sulfurtransferase
LRVSVAFDCFDNKEKRDETASFGFWRHGTHCNWRRDGTLCCGDHQGFLGNGEDECGRGESEWDKGHIEGSIFLPLSAFKKGVKKEQLAKVLPKERILYTFCVVGKRAVTAGNILEDFGYEVRALKPGYKQLVRAGFEKAEKKQKGSTQ